MYAIKFSLRETYGLHIPLLIGYMLLNKENKVLMILYFMIEGVNFFIVLLVHQNENFFT